MNTQCRCRFILTVTNLFDVCITPAIEKVKSIIYASLTNTCLFGNYKISHIVMMGSLIQMDACKSTYPQTLIRLKNIIDNHRKYFDNINIEWVDDDDNSIIKQGIQSIIRNPFGGLLEQIFAGRYLIWCDYKLYCNFNREQAIKKYTEHPFIIRDTRVTEDIYENGLSHIFYMNTDNAQFIVQVSG
ncbi:hypothetical protein BDB01DRAFT_478823 [Pilobolus umbonatus]|nr:hypothetical protein BDB01DRAFT_478823 [Pilobolus umbonatus]